MPLVKLTFCWLPTFFLLENRYDIGVVVTGRLTAVLSTLHRPARTQHIRTAGHGGCCNKTPPDIIKRNNFKKKFENFWGGERRRGERGGDWSNYITLQAVIRQWSHKSFENNTWQQITVGTNFTSFKTLLYGLLLAQTSPPSTTAPFYCWSE